MVTPFETAILKLKELGFFEFFLPFLLTSAIFYGILRKTQLFGDPDKNIVVNSVVALAISFFVWAAPVILGIDIEAHLAAFFIQGFSVTLIFLVGLILAGMFFPPDLPKALSERIKAGWLWSVIIIVAIVIGLILLISSGLYKVIFPGISISISSDVLITIGIIILIVGSIVGIVWATTRGGK